MEVKKLTWSEYKTLIQPTIKNYGRNQTLVLTSDLCFEVGQLLKCVSNECKNQKEDRVARVIQLGNIFWNIAAIEICYGLPDNIFKNLLGMTFDLDPAQMQYEIITEELLFSCGSVSRYAMQGNILELQYELNQLFSSVLDYATKFNINSMECIQSSIVKLNLRKENSKSSHTNEYKAVKENIKKSGKEQLLLDITVNSEGKYKSLVAKYKTVKMVFDSGDLLVDFFHTINKVKETFTDTNYSINYSNKFRKFMSDHRETILSGFIINERLVSTTELLKTRKAANGILSLGGDYKPIIFYPNMEKLDDLLDYVNKVDKSLK